MPVIKRWRIEVEADAREVYEVEAASEDEARAAWDRGEAGDPLVSEVIAGSIESVELVDA
jgi:hypothetical protein